MAGPATRVVAVATPFDEIPAAPPICTPAEALDSARRPLVAHCISGVARSFSHPSLLLPRLFQRNVIGALGGEPSVFLLLKTFETAPKDALFRFPARIADDVQPGGGAAQLRRLDRAIALLRPAEVQLVTSDNFTFNSARKRHASRLPS
jgi:hypothetical protein